MPYTSVYATWLPFGGQGEPWRARLGLPLASRRSLSGGTVVFDQEHPDGFLVGDEVRINLSIRAIAQ